MKEKSIHIKVKLDDQSVPEEITWKADDQTNSTEQPCKGLLLSLFDGERKETLKIDLWTKHMEVGEMDRFVFHAMRSMADTYYKATQNADLANDMQRFVQYFGEQTNIIPKENT